MPLNEAKFAELLCTKLCHEITGPIGAVNNGIEFLMEEIPDLNNQSSQLIANSATEATTRLLILRQALGQNISDSQVNLREIKELAENYFAQHKIQLHMPDELLMSQDLEITSIERKIILNLLLIGSHAIIRGGDIKFNVEGGVISIICSGPKVVIDDAVLNWLSNGFDESQLDARNVQYFYVAEMVKSCGKKLGVNKTEGELMFELK